MTLYEIDQAIMSCVDEETGEIADEEKLNALLIDRDTKIESVVLWIKDLKAELAALKAERDAFNERIKSIERKIESLTKWLMTALNGEKFSTSKCAVSYIKSTVVEVAEELLPTKYKEKVISWKVDKNNLKALLKSGQKIKGASLIEKLNPQIK